MALDVTEALKGSLGNLGGEFKSDRLAYLSLTSKNERELCGMLAHCLQRRFGLDGDRLVVREWAAEPYTEGGKVKRPRIDIAVLKDGEPLVMIEAKSAWSFNLVENWEGKRPRCYPSAEVSDDVKKLNRIDCSGDRYVLTFFTDAGGVPSRKHSAAIPYFDGIRKQCPISQGLITKGFERFHAATEKKGRSNLRKVDEGQIHVGNAFNIDVSVYYWLLRVSSIVKE